MWVEILTKMDLQFIGKNICLSRRREGFNSPQIRQFWGRMFQGGEEHLQCTCEEFDSPRLHHICPVRQAVKSSPFQGEVMGSNPIQDTNYLCVGRQMVWQEAVTLPTERLLVVQVCPNAPFWNNSSVWQSTCLKSKVALVRFQFVPPYSLSSTVRANG